MKSAETLRVPFAHRRPGLVWSEPADPHRLAALELMPIAIVLVTAPIADLLEIFIEQRVPAIAVIAADQGLSGIVTRTDVLRAVHDAHATADDLMSCFIFALPLDATIASAAALMATEGVGQIVVTSRGGELVGMVSALDVARYVARRAGYLAA